MKPRVFISSTYYDLRHVRDKIEHLLLQYHFEPVLFEKDSVTFEPGKKLDSSCYNEVRLCHIMILIIGGRYGTIATGETEEQRKFYENEHISITRQEYASALEKGIPAFIFIDKNVFAEYRTYKENAEFISSLKNGEFRFAHVDDRAVFHFIDNVVNNAIKTFESFDDIEHYLKSQFAGMFYNYLDNLQKEKSDSKILDTISEMNNISNRMNEMMNEIGRKILAEEEFERIKDEQFRILIEYFVESIGRNIGFEVNYQISIEENLDKIVSLIFSYLIDNKPLVEKLKVSSLRQAVNVYENEVENLNEALRSSFKGFQVKINNIAGLRILNDYEEKIKPFIKGKATLKTILVECLGHEIGSMMSLLLP